MRKVIASILLSLLVSPLMAEEKILKCYPWGLFSKNNLKYNYYKMEISSRGSQSYFIKDGLEWRAFCEGKNSARYRMIKDLSVASYEYDNHVPIKKTKGNKTVSCLYEVDKKNKTNRIQIEKLTINFNNSTSSHCHGDFLGLECYESAQNYKCYSEMR
tara:strand:+ start:36 stop:509 length:474 start_codon:yes stop_codon:yes gene_type:complete